MLFFAEGRETQLTVDMGVSSLWTEDGVKNSLRRLVLILTVLSTQYSVELSVFYDVVF